MIKLLLWMIIISVATPTVCKIEDNLKDSRDHDKGKTGVTRRLLRQAVEESESWTVAYVTQNIDSVVPSDELQILISARYHGYGTGKLINLGEERKLITAIGGRVGDIIIFPPKKYKKNFHGGQIHLGKHTWSAVQKLLTTASEMAEREHQQQQEQEQESKLNNKPDDVVKEIALRSVGNSMNGVLDVTNELPNQFPLLLLIYSVECPYSQMLSPVWEELGVLFFSSNEITIAKTSCPRIENLLEVDEYPTVILFNTLTSFVKYPHAFQLRPLVSWLKHVAPDLKTPFTPTQFTDAQARIFTVLGQSELLNKIVKEKSTLVDVHSDGIGKLLTESWNTMRKDEIDQDHTKKVNNRKSEEL